MDRCAHRLLLLCRTQGRIRNDIHEASRSNVSPVSSAAETMQACDDGIAWTVAANTGRHVRRSYCYGARIVLVLTIGSADGGRSRQMAARRQCPSRGQTFLNSAMRDRAHVPSKRPGVDGQVTGGLAQRHGGGLVTDRSIRLASRRDGAARDDEVFDGSTGHSAQESRTAARA